MSDPKAEWAAAFTAAQAAMPSIPKSKRATIETRGGGGYSYAYADLPSIIEAIQPVLKAHGLAVAQSVTGGDGQVGVETRIYHTAGHVESFGPLHLPAGGDARSVGSAVTYARRYALCAALGIAADEDDDGQAARPGDSRTVQGVDNATPPVDITSAIRAKVAIFDRWSEDERRAIWKAHAQAVLGGRPKTLAEVDKVIRSMQEQYLEQFPDDGRPF